MKDIRSLLLALLSFGLVATWVYHFYDKSTYSNRPPEVVRIDSSAIIGHIRDSLERSYSAAIGKLDLQLDSSYSTSDSLYARLNLTEQQLNSKIQEANHLKAEIAGLLAKPNVSSDELVLARQKIAELESIVKELRSDKSGLETEKKELATKLDQMGQEMTGLQQSIHRISDENKSMVDKIKAAETFVASALHFAALHTRSEKEQETSQAKRADKLVASFILQNNFNDFPSAEVMIVILQPDERVLQNSTWDSGSFETKAGSKKNYTRKMRFDYNKGEQKALIFTMGVDGLEKGIYTLQIWHNGVLIGEVARTLS